MALVFNGIKVNMGGGQVPTGALPSSYTPVQGDYVSIDFVFGIDKASVEAAVPSDTWNTLINFLDTAIQTKLSNDYNTSNSVEAYAELNGINSNLQGDANNSDMYKNIVPEYLCHCIIHVKVS